MAAWPHVALLNATVDESEMYAYWLTSRGYRVSVVRDLAIACHLATYDPFDVLVIDAVFERRDGNGRFQELRNLPERQGFRILTLSGYFQQDERCILKPCLPHHLSKAIDELVATPSACPAKAHP